MTDLLPGKLDYLTDYPVVVVILFYFDPQGDTPVTITSPVTLFHAVLAFYQFHSVYSNVFSSVYCDGQ